jgi:sugar O-acyltransferase (sialic acid O-acetyltransferase NeuD family)
MMTPSGAGLEGLVIVGSGGFGREVLQLVADINAHQPTFDLLGFLDDNPADVRAIERLGARMLGSSSALADLQAAIVIAIAAPTPRRRIDEHARAIGLRAARLVHPWASVGTSVVIEEGVVIGAGSRLTTSVVVGRHAHVNVNCTIGHDAVLESFVTVFPGVHVSGGCRVEEGAILGTGCVLLPGVCVGRDAEVGAGAVVVRDVAPGTIVVAPAGRPTLRAASSGGLGDPLDNPKGNPALTTVGSDDQRG